VDERGPCGRDRGKGDVGELAPAVAVYQQHLGGQDGPLVPPVTLGQVDHESKKRGRAAGGDHVSGVHDRAVAAETARNEWGEVFYHAREAILELRWLASTADMSDDGFKATLELFADEAERVRVPALLIDTTEFGHRPGPDAMKWRDREIIPRYNAAAVTRFAFHVPEGFPGAVEAGGEPVVSAPATFPTAWFTDREHAVDWLGER